MITTLAFIAALTVTPAEESAIIRLVMDKYFLDHRSHPPAKQSLFIVETMDEGKIDDISLRVPPSTPEQVDELVESWKTNNRESIALPELPGEALLGDAGDLKTEGRYDWDKIANKTGGVEGVIEVSRPAFTRDGNVAVVRIVIRQPQADKQELYFLKRFDDKWRVVSFGGGRVKP